jgi:hypothetical protein
MITAAQCRAAAAILVFSTYTLPRAPAECATISFIGQRPDRIEVVALVPIFGLSQPLTIHLSAMPVELQFRNGGWWSPREDCGGVPTS